MRWAIQSTLINPIHSVQVLDAVKALGKPFVLADHIPFDDKFIEPIEGTDLIPYGSTTVMKMALRDGWEGLAFNHRTFRHTFWVGSRDDMLNADARVMTVADAAVEADCWPIVAKWFIRPNDDLKMFSGVVLPVKEIYEWFTKATDSSKGSFNPTDEIICAIPQDIRAEWRCFVVDGHVIDSSMYRCNGEQRLLRETNPALKAQFKRMAGEWLPHRNCVMDIALVDDGFKVIEFNCINCSGFYDHDIPLIVKCLDKSYG